MEVIGDVKIRRATVDIPSKIHEDLMGLSKENMRTFDQELIYRLAQGIKMSKHISENDEGLLKIIASLYDRNDFRYET